MALCDLFCLCDNEPYALMPCTPALQPAYLQKGALCYQQITVIRSTSVHFPFLLFLERCGYREAFSAAKNVWTTTI